MRVDLIENSGEKSVTILGRMENCFSTKVASNRKYWDLPCYGSTVVKIVISANRNPGGSLTYRRSGVYYASVGYDFSGGVITQATLSNMFLSTSPLGGTFDVQLDIDNIGLGLQRPGIDKKSNLLISIPDTYGSESLIFDYELSNG